MNPAPRLTVDLARPNEWAAVRALIIRGLTERWGSYESSCNPDLEAFGRCYADAVVVAAKEEGAIVGCGVLRKERDGVGRIVRMSVLGERQRRGIGSAVLCALLERAEEIGYHEVVLETTASWESAVSFYKGHGFIPTVIRDGDQHFRYPLQRTGSGAHPGA